MTLIDMAIEPKSDQLNADDLIGGPRTITITGIESKGGDQPIWIYCDGDKSRPWKPCKTMRKIMVSVWPTTKGKLDAEYMIGKRITLYLDPFVKWGGQEVGGIRISHMSGIDEEKTVLVTVTRGRKAPWTVKPLPDEELSPQPPQITVEEAQDAARQAAAGGKDAFAMWWNTDFGKSCRELVKPIMDDLKETSEKADQEKDVL